jgi:myo-inositol-1-phosphate synthase
MENQSTIKKVNFVEQFSLFNENDEFTNT